MSAAAGSNLKRNPTLSTKTRWSHRTRYRLAPVVLPTACFNTASIVYAVDCGTHQLHDRMRNHERVIVMEQTNARYLTTDDFATNRLLLN